MPLESRMNLLRPRKQFLELQSKTVLQHSPKQLGWLIHKKKKLKLHFVVSPRYLSDYFLAVRSRFILLLVLAPSLEKANSHLAIASYSSDIWGLHLNTSLG